MPYDKQILAGVAGIALLLTGACSRSAAEDPAKGAQTQQLQAEPATTAGQQPAATPQRSSGNPAADLLACGGPFGPGTTLASLKAAFGDDAVKEEELYGPEAIAYPGIVIHGADPARRIEVALPDPQGEGPRFGWVTVRGTGSRWALPSGITVGSSIADVAAANGGPFKFSGLGWDYGGAVTDWQGGALGQDQACQVQIVFGLPENAGELDNSILGDTIVSSTDPALANAGIVVSEVGISWETPAAGQ